MPNRFIEEEGKEGERGREKEEEERGGRKRRKKEEGERGERKRRERRKTETHLMADEEGGKGTGLAAFCKDPLDSSGALRMRKILLKKYRNTEIQNKNKGDRRGCE